MKDDFLGTFKSLWIIHPEERWTLILAGFLCALCTPIVAALYRIKLTRHFL